MDLDHITSETVYLKCLNVDYSILILKNDSLRMYGMFEFQVLFGNIEANGYHCIAKKFNIKNFINVSVSVVDIPVFMILKTSNFSSLNVDVLTSRLRDFVDNPSQLASSIVSNYPQSAVILIRHKHDISSKFICQQHTEFIYKAPSKYIYNELSNMCYAVFNSKQSYEKEQNYIYSSDECSSISRIIEKIEREAQINSAKGDCGKIFFVGNKSAGKSTLMHFIINSLLSKISEKSIVKRIFLLDIDVGQSELTPSGLISLHEIMQPFLSAKFANQKDSFARSFFFGSITPAVNFDFYKNLSLKCLQLYNSIKSPNSILFINTCGWIEDLGYDLTCSLINDFLPSLLINVQIDELLSFEVPHKYRQITCNFKRKTSNLELISGHKPTFAVLRNFLFAGYFAKSLLMRSPTLSTDELRLADVLPYRVRFQSISLYFHPELHYVVDQLVFSALNCSIVGLCIIDFKSEDFTDNFYKRRVCSNNTLPERIEYKVKESIEKIENQKTAPIMRCIGYGFVRSIDTNRKLFHIITPVEQLLLKSVNVFAIGHELHSSSILFDSKGLEPAPYLVEIEKHVSRNHQKLFSPLRNRTGLKRVLGFVKRNPRRSSLKTHHRIDKKRLRRN